MEVLKIGQTLNYNYRLHNNILGQGRNDGGLRDLMVAMPFMPVYNENGDWYRTADMTADKWGWMPSQVHNPIARQVHTNRGLRLNKTHGLNASVNVQLQPIQNLFFRSQYSYSFNATSNRNATIAGSFGSHSEGFDRVDMEQNINFNWQVSNTATYIFKVQEHDFTAMIGQEAYKTGYGERVRAAGRRLQFDLNEMGFDYAWLSNLQTAASVDDRSNVEGAPASEYSIASFFGRLQWNLGGTYMADLIFRADGSSRFARGNRWGYFPAVSAGWVLTNEEFMESQNIFNHLRLRASWGLNGNQQVSAFQYLTTYTYGTGNNIPVPNYFFGENKRAPVVGIRPDRLRNPDITWERQNQVNIGIDMRYLNNRLGLNIDLYNRLTENWLLDAPISATWGYAAPNVNGGSVRNQGAEFALSWNERRGDFRYGINVNGSYNKNKVVSIANPEGLIYGTTNVLAEPTHEIFRLQVGQPMGVFYLYKHDGIFQTQAEVDAHVNSQGVKIQPNAVAGDIRFRDVNDDGVINLDDRVFQGSGWPTTRLNFSINAGYKGFDFMVAANGAFGHKILKSYRSFADRPWENFTTHVFQRWTGYGSTNFYPRLTNGAHINYTNISGLWMEKGDYLKLANITLGYDFKNLVPSMPFSRARIYFTAQNLLVITGYSGMDPEVGRGAGGRDWAAGIDYGFWPSARTFLGGIQLTF
jgi:TonB-linked SusC/RagA family outer membrane protein